MCRVTNGGVPLVTNVLTPRVRPRYDQRMNLRSPRTWGWLAAICTAIGLLNFGHFSLDDLARGHSGTFAPRFIEEMTGAYTVLAIVPIVVWVGRRVSWSPKTWAIALAANIAGLVAFSAAHTTLMAATRAVLFPLAGLGPYRYGLMAYRYPMEAANDTISYVLIAIAAYVLSRFAAAREAELAAARLQGQLAEARMENLRLQLHPHFLFNTLNAISAVMYEDVRKADEMLVKLSDFLRGVLESGSVHSVPLHEELSVERSYVEIMTTRLERPFAFNVRVDEDARTAQIPFMILQPLLENSIRHGLRADRAGLDIEIIARREAGDTIVEVLDDGAGIAGGARRGHGLANVESRLLHMYGGDASSFTIAPRDGGGTHVTIRIPYAAAAEASAV